MRILFVQAGVGAGGAEKIVNLLAEHRATLGDEVHVLAFDSRPGGSYFPYRDAVSVETFEPTDQTSKRGSRRVVRRLLWLRRRFRELHPDLIVSFLTKTNVLAALASLGLATRLVISERNNPGRQRAHPIWQPASKFLARRATAVVMQTEAALATLPRGVQGRALVIPNPCTTELGNPKTSGDGCRIIAVGRLDHQKGFDMLLEAFARIAPGTPDATLTIFGEGPERKPLETQVRALGISGRVSLPGVTETPGDWQDAGDIFVLSSRFEGFPNVLVEALAGGFAAIAFDCPWGPSSILTHKVNGILVPPEDVDTLAEAMKSLVDDKEQRDALRKAAPESVSRFSIPGVLKQWDEIITEETND
jgi:glycosyltransferase involved in cell wall biosynthesis